nr:MAG TPA: hypothetical protein [Caudoviricetes sp.]
MLSAGLSITGKTVPSVRTSSRTSLPIDARS